MQSFHIHISFCKVLIHIGIPLPDKLCLSFKRRDIFYSFNVTKKLSITNGISFGIRIVFCKCIFYLLRC